MQYWEVIKNGFAPTPTAQARFPLARLQVGEAFMVPFEEESRLRRAAGNFNAKHKHSGKHVSVRLVDNGVWCGRLR